MTLAREELEKDGFAKIKSVIPSKLAFEQTTSIWQNLEEFATQTESNLSNYLTAVSRWVTPSPIVKKLDSILLDKIESLINTTVGPCSFIKSNLISKTVYAPGCIPFHQDISYSPTNPYDVTAWLMLTDCPENSGCLRFVKGSHLQDINPAMDFWSPDFVDKVESKFRNYAVNIPGKAGDVILFDSRVYHSSGFNKIGFNRFAYVTRWRLENSDKKRKIPPISASYFGMWTCSDLTKKILSKSLIDFFNIIPPTNYCELLQLWKELYFLSSISINLEDAKRSLDNVIILNKAHELHYGGDGQGIHYKNLWHDLLKKICTHST
ncbi:MAG: hypothetical protein CMM87_00095 [Rickettsiales bacterium]|mgnify:CR=1 FL=1|nr:hypothetical protein [Rickettsiales bacterium]|tara:strand:+ start:20967 stop:21932 length:966 start_codon:yes stop_codon:yes gene_type:complete